MNPIYWDLGDGVAIRTYTPDDAEEAFALVDANRVRLHPWMIWEPRTRSPADTRAERPSGIPRRPPRSMPNTGFFIGRVVL